MSEKFTGLEPVVELNRVCKAMADSNWKYLCIETKAGERWHGGNQHWWFRHVIDKPSREDAKKWPVIFSHAKRDEAFRITFLGCGVISMVDLELYCCMFHPEFQMHIGREISFADGIISQELYEGIVEARWKKDYHIDRNSFNLHVGLYPWRMEKGIAGFLRQNKYGVQKVKWAPYLRYGNAVQKRHLLAAIKEMLNKNLPVVCAYHTFDPKHRKLTLYRNPESAKRKLEATKQDAVIDSHYMTIIGLFRDENEKLYLQIVSWGIIYYTGFDEFSESLNLFTNILLIS